MDLMTAVDVLRASMIETPPRLSAALAATIPHRALAELSANCPYAPLKTHGESPGRPGSAITTTDVAKLQSLVPARGSWQGRATLAGADVPVLVLASDVTTHGALLVLILTKDIPVPDEHVAHAQALWDLVTAHRDGLRSETIPGKMALSRAAAAARSVALAELGDAHGATLGALLRVLRDRDLDHETARTRAVDLAVSALAEVRSRTKLDQTLVEEQAGEAFKRLAESLRRMLRDRDVRLDLGTPGAEEGADRLLPKDVSHTACAVVQAVVHASLQDQGLGLDGGQVSRIHVAWKVATDELRATVRDDGPGTLSRAAIDTFRVSERLAPLSGRLELDAVPGWGTTVTIEIPLGPLEAPRQDPLTMLGDRELEVLGQLAQGRRNRDIAQELHISESTVKFHVRNILEKLGASSRGEAAALAHEWGAI
jgi:DNA-binding CsgD family transcriptional regulator